MNINDRIHLISKGLITWTTIFSLDHIFSAGSSSTGGLLFISNQMKYLFCGTLSSLGIKNFPRQPYINTQLSEFTVHWYIL